jgi:hypothetical protein
VAKKDETSGGLPVLRRPEAVFRSEEDLRNYCGAAGERLTDYSIDISLAAAQIRAQLGQIPDGTGVAITSKIRAVLVTAHLRTCAKVLETAAAYGSGAYAAYCKQFAKERAEARARAGAA